MKACGSIALILAAACGTLGPLKSVAASQSLQRADAPARPSLTLGQPLPSEALGLLRPDLAPPATAEGNAPRFAGLPKADQVSLAQALSAARREIRTAEAKTGALLLASNPGQRLAARFLPSSVRIGSTLAGRDWQARFSLAGQPSPTALAAKGDRMEYVRGSVIEWYENRPDGLEHGVILRERPAGADAELCLRVAVDGLRSRASAGDPGALDLVDAQQNVVLRYTKLLAWDADGAVLPSRLESDRQGLAIRVADAGARYPVTIDPLIISFESKVGPDVSGTDADSDYYGFSADVSSNAVIIGAYQDDDKGTESGSAYIFTRSNAVWSLQAKLTAADGAASDWFGYAVRIAGDTAVIGAYGDDDSGADSGSVYVFTRSGTNWTQQAKLLAADGVANDYFGSAVAVDGDTAMVGAYKASATGASTSDGCAYVFTRSGTTWSQQAKLVAPDGADFDSFGYSVGVAGDTVIAGAYKNTLIDGYEGSAYVFTRTDSVWNLEAKLTAADSALNDNFGCAVAIDGDTAVIGSYRDDDNGTDSGSAYVFTRSGTVWSQQAKITASDGAATDWFGSAVGISGDTVVVGAYKDDDSSGADAGGAYTFFRSDATWSQQARLAAGDGAAKDGFGSAVAVWGNTAVIGASLDDDKGADAGCAYVFTHTGTTWTRQAKLTASDGAANDNFGCSVGLYGDTVVVGAYLDDDKGTDSGSVYIFTRTNATWSQQAKLTTSDGVGNDFFGFSVGIENDTVVGGAYRDDTYRGSAYVFVRSGTNWSQQAKLTASDGAANDYFGYSVGISSNTVIAGAYKDDDKGTDSGSIYFYTRSGTTWSQQAKLTISDGAANDYLGAAVGISDDTAIAGAYRKDSYKGSAFIFARTNSVWSRQAKLTAADGSTGDYFGWSVAVFGTVAIAGAYRDDTYKGGAYVYSRPNSSTNWTQMAKLTATDGAANDNFGYAVGLSGEAALIGANADDGVDAGVGIAVDQGSATFNHLAFNRTLFMIK